MASSTRYAMVLMMVLAATVVVVTSVLTTTTTTTTTAFAQEGQGMRQTTTDGTLDLLLEPTWNPGSPGSTESQASFRVSFLNPGTDTLHEHQDYDFRILNSNGEQVFSAARQTNQPLLHNVPGTITVPYTFQEMGDYTIEVYLGGTGIGPTLIPTDETAKFNVVVTPEFPVGALGAIAALIGTAIVLSRSSSNSNSNSNRSSRFRLRL
jgi:hypothetical protein